MSTPARQPGGGADDVVAALVLGALGVVTAAGAVVWAGALAAGLLRAELVVAEPAEVLAALRALPDHLGDPAAAWPWRVGSALPGPVAYWAAQLVVITAVVGAAVVCVRHGVAHWFAMGRRHALQVPADAGMARARDLGRLRVRAAVPGRLTIGRAGHSLVAAERGASLAVVGPTGCGKTAGFAIPALLEWRGPVLATSVKADLLDATLAHRKTRGRVWVYDPTDSAGAGPSARWSPLASCVTWAGAVRTASWLAEATQPKRDSVTDGDYWYTQARRGLGPYLFAAANSGRNMAELVDWVDGQEVEEVEAVLASLKARTKAEPHFAGAEHALVVARSLWRKEARLRGSVFSTMENVVAPYADPGVAKAAEKPNLDLGKWLSGDNTIYVVATAHEQARLRPVLTVLVQQLVRAAYEGAAARGGALEHPCLVLLDEAANIAPLPDLPGYAATARSHGITFVSIWQDLAQVGGLYGEGAQTVLNNHGAKLFGSGIADVATLEYLSRLVGEERQVERQRSWEVAAGRRSVAEHGTYRRLAPPDLLRRIRPGEAVLLYGAELPAHIRLRPWFSDGVLKALGAKP